MAVCLRWSEQKCVLQGLGRQSPSDRHDTEHPGPAVVSVLVRFRRSISTASHSVCSDFRSTCLVSGCLLRRRLISILTGILGLRHDSLYVPLLQPSCQLHSRQFADDDDNKRVDNHSSGGDEHNDVDVRGCYWRDKRASVFHADDPWLLLIHRHQHRRDASHLRGQHSTDRWRRRWLAPAPCCRRARRFSPQTSSIACRETRTRDEAAGAIQLRCDQIGPAQSVRRRSTRFQQRSAGAIQLRRGPCDEIF